MAGETRVMNIRNYWGMKLVLSILAVGLSTAIASAAPPMLRGTMPARPMPAAYNYYPRSYYQPFAPYYALSRPYPYYNNFAYQNYMAANVAIAQAGGLLPYAYNPYPYGLGVGYGYPLGGVYNYSASYYNPLVNPYATYNYSVSGVNPYLWP